MRKLCSMEFELCKIDPQTCSIEELENEIERLEKIKGLYDSQQYGIKIYINSIYGATASVYFTGYNVNVAEAITLQGQDVIFFSEKIINHYFQNIWHIDSETHQKMGIKNVRKIPDNSKFVVYGDTDSLYITFDHALQSCDWEGDPKDFILMLKDLKLNSYFKEKFDEYAKDHNTQNIQNFELEKIARNAIMLAKKKYILDIAWKDPGISYGPQEKITYTGVEIIQSSSPKFARKVLKELILYAFQNGKNIDYTETIKKLKEYRKEFSMQDPNDISKGVSIGDYEKYVLEDRKEIVLGDKCPINNRAAAVYNYLLFNSKWKSKYNLIRTDDKIKFYYSKGEYGVFGFIPGNLPYEFAPEIDYELQFEKVIVEPFNRIIEVLGFNSIPGNLIYNIGLF